MPARSIATAAGASDEYCTTADASSHPSACRELYTVPSSRTARSALLLVPLRGKCSTCGTLYREREATVAWAPLSEVSGIEAVAVAEAEAPKVAMI